MTRSLKPLDANFDDDGTDSQSSAPSACCGGGAGGASGGTTGRAAESGPHVVAARSPARLIRSIDSLFFFGPSVCPSHEASPKLCANTFSRKFLLVAAFTPARPFLLSLKRTIKRENCHRCLYHTHHHRCSSQLPPATRMSRTGTKIFKMASDVVRDGVFGRSCALMAQRVKCICYISSSRFSSFLFPSSHISSHPLRFIPQFHSTSFICVRVAQNPPDCQSGEHF